MLDTILFDLDGTLIDTMDLIVACWQHATGLHCGAAISREDVLPTIGLPLLAALEAYAPGNGDALYAAYQQHNAVWHDKMALLVPGTVEMLARLRGAGVRTGLVTSKRHESLRRGLDLYALAPYLDAVIGFEDSARHKPNPDPILAALERLGRSPDRASVAYIGDAVSDIECALAAGVRAVGVPWGAATPAALLAAGAEPVLGDWEELIALAGR
ncbi:MAG: HAD-IA family hydrolase [Chloroflexia bacterium]